MAKAATIAIKMLSTADTGFFYVAKKTRARNQRNSNFGSTILSYESMSYLKKRKLNK